MRFVFSVLVALGALIGVAKADIPPAARAVSVVVLGEIHDNPQHHETQAEWIKRLEPAALVFEMLTAEQADRIKPDMLPDRASLRETLGWDQSGWPDFAMYYPLFTAAPVGAKFYGARVPRGDLMALGDTPLATFAGDLVQLFALDQALPQAEQTAREALQHAAHCDALPVHMLPMMVDAQRLRDATLADVTRTALRDTGGPVVVITGNGHARRDWGVPYLLGLVGVDDVYALGQSEDGTAPQGKFDLILDAPPVTRPDPCAAFR